MNHSNNRQLFPIKYPYQLLLALLFLAVYILPLGIRPLITPDETRYAEIPREMIATGNWITPRFNGLHYFEKPDLGYWIHAVSIRFLGENNFAVRLPAPLSVGLSALLIFFLLYRTRKRREDEPKSRQHVSEPLQSSLLASFIFLVSFEVFGVGSTAVLDNLLALFLTATITFFYFASESVPGSRREKIYLLLSGSACGMAFMTKGFLAFAVPVMTLSAYLIWERRYRDLWRMSWIPLLTAVLISTPWSIMIHLRDPDFWNFFFWNEHIRRFLSGNAQHEKNFFYYFICAPGMIMPWTFVTPAAFSGIRERFRRPNPEGRLIRLSICWLVLPFLFFSCVSGKILTYILPCFPPFAMLMAIGLLQGLRETQRQRFFRRGALANTILFGLILIVFGATQFLRIGDFVRYAQAWKVLLGINGLVVAIMLSFLAGQGRKQTHKIILLGLAPVLIFLSAHFLIPDATLVKRAPGTFLTRYQPYLTKDTLIIAEHRLAGAVCWYLKRDDIYILGRGGEFKYGLTYKDATGRQMDLETTADFIRHHPGGVVLIARMKELNNWRAHLPQPVFATNNGAKGIGLWKF